MKVNLKTRKLYTDTDEFIKKLDCKHKITYSDLSISRDKNTIGGCHHCKKAIYKTENLSDVELLKKVKENPSICFYVDLHQENISHVEFKNYLYFENLSGMCSFKCFDCKHITKEIIIFMRENVKDPHQCQECGTFSESKNPKCNHINSISKNHPIICEKCMSKNLIIDSHFIG